MEAAATATTEGSGSSQQDKRKEAEEAAGECNQELYPCQSSQASHLFQTGNLGLLAMVGNKKLPSSFQALLSATGDLLRMTGKEAALLLCLPAASS